MNYSKFVSAHSDYNDEINLNRSVHSMLLLKCRLRHTHLAVRCVVYTADKRGCRRSLSTAVVDGGNISRCQHHFVGCRQDRHDGIDKPADGGDV